MVASRAIAKKVVVQEMSAHRIWHTTRILLRGARIHGLAAVLVANARKKLAPAVANVVWEAAFPRNSLTLCKLIAVVAAGVLEAGIGFAIGTVLVVPFIIIQTSGRGGLFRDNKSLSVSGRPLRGRTLCGGRLVRVGPSLPALFPERVHHICNAVLDRRVVLDIEAHGATR
jgi:hypothetical protein